MIIFQHSKQADRHEITFFGIKFTFQRRKLPPHINKEEVAAQIKVLTEKGITEQKRTPRVIVSLTSFPERIQSDVEYTLYSLLTQSFKPDEIILWLAKEQFPNGLDDLPDNIRNFQKNGLTIKWCTDLRSYKKLIPTLKEYPDDIIVTADDDIYYPQDWLQKLYVQYCQDSEAIIGHRMHYIRLDDKGQPLPYKKWAKNITKRQACYRNFLTGCGGILYPPHCLYKDVCDEELFRKLTPYADDIWFWAMAVLNDTPIKTFSDRYRKIILVNPEREMRQTDELTLAKLNISKGGNDQQLLEILAHYPELAQKIKKA